jgi:hypothetical protein
MKKFAFLLVTSILLAACEPMIIPGQKVEGMIEYSDHSKVSNANGNTYFSDTYQLTGAEGDKFKVELWSDEGARMNLEHKKEEGYYPEGICYTAGEGEGDGEATLIDGTNYFNVYLIDQDMKEDGVAYSFLFTEM